MTNFVKKARSKYLLIPFKYVPVLVAKRLVHLSDGMARVYFWQFDEVFVQVFKLILRFVTFATISYIANMKQF